MKFKIFIVLLFLIIQSCAVKETIVDKERDEIIGGYVKNRAMSIGKPNTFSYEIIKRWQDIGIIPRFNNKARIKKIDIFKTHRYTTSKGIQIGDPISKVESIYGKPKSRKLDYGMSDNVHWVYDALVYKHMLFYTDTTQKVIAYSIGGNY